MGDQTRSFGQQQEHTRRPAVETQSWTTMDKSGGTPHSSSLSPLVILQEPSGSTGGSAAAETAQPKAISAVCFLPSQQEPLFDEENSHDDHDEQDDDAASSSSSSSSSSTASSSDEEYDPTYSSCAQRVTAGSPSAAVVSRRSLAGRTVVACQPNGVLRIWDIHQQRLVQSIDTGRPLGLTLRRLADDDKDNQNSPVSPILFQTRNPPLGTVSIHDPQRSDWPVINQWQTRSLTFCAAVPCRHDPHLVILPSSLEKEQAHAVQIYDIRASPREAPAYSFAAAVANKDHTQKCGMLMSLASLKSSRHDSLLHDQDNNNDNDNNNNHRLLVACGMENGHVHVHDLAMMSSSSSVSSSVRSFVGTSTSSSSSISLGTDPVLSLDISQSSSNNIMSSTTTRPTTTNSIHNNNHDTTNTNTISSSFVMVAGLGGDSAELEQLDQSHRGRVAVVKGQQEHLAHDHNAASGHGDTDDNSSHVSPWKLRIRARVGMGQESPTVHKKAGVSVVRWRPGDGRLLAIGGWDRRVRIYDRKGSTPLAVLKGHHEGSVDSLDWAPDAASSGLLATGSSDGVVNVWKCFGSEGLAS